MGLVAGPGGNIWFVLLGGGGGGNGTFGRICEGGAIEYLRLKGRAAMGASLIHLAFSPDAERHGAPSVGMSSRYARVESQQTIAFPSRSSMSHRVLPTGQDIYATELGASSSTWRRGIAWGAKKIDEMSDAYALWGCGVPTSSAEY